MACGVLGFIQSAAAVEVRRNPVTGEIELLGPEELEREAEEKQSAMSFEERVNMMYEGCLDKAYAYMSTDVQALYCSCVSANVTHVMSEAQLIEMLGSGAQAREQQARMMMFAQAPCTSYAARTMAVESCLQTEGVKNPRTTCQCMGVQVWKELYINAASIVESRIRMQSDIEGIDAADVVFSSPGYQGSLNRARTHCIAMHE